MADEDIISESQLASSETEVVSRAVHVLSERIQQTSGAGSYHFSSSLNETLVHGFDAVRLDLRNMTGAVEDVGAAVRDMTAVLSGQLHQLAEISEQQLAELQKIHDSLRAPKEVAGNELRNRGLQAYGFGHIEASERDFTDALDENPYDYTSLLLLGHIDLREGRFEDGIEKYRLAELYSEPRGAALIAAFAKLGQSRCEQGAGQNAEAATSAAIAEAQLSEERWDGPYELARANALAGNLEHAIEPLSRALARGPLVVSSICVAERVAMPLMEAQQLAQAQAEVLADSVAALGRMPRPPTSGSLLSQVDFNLELIEQALGRTKKWGADDEAQLAQERAQQVVEDAAREQALERAHRKQRRSESTKEALWLPTGIVGFVAGVILVFYILGDLLTSSVAGNLILLAILAGSPWVAVRLLDRLWPRPSTPATTAVAPLTRNPEIENTLDELLKLAANPLGGSELASTGRRSDPG